MEPRKQSKQTEMIGLRVDEKLFSAIKRGAEEEGISTTSFARLLIAQALGYFQEVPMEPPRRQARRKPPSADMKKAVQVLVILTDINMTLSGLLRAIRIQSVEKAIPEMKPATQLDCLKNIQTSVSDIRDHLLGEAR